MENQLLAVECLTHFFWNFKSEEIRELQRKSTDFKYVFDTYISHLSGEATFNEFWRCWHMKFSIATKEMLIDYCVEKFGAENAQNIQFAKATAAMWKRMESED